MAGKFDLNKEITLGGQSGKRPTKTSINLVIKKERKISLVKLIGIIVLVLLLIVLFVVKPIISLRNANARVSQLQAELDETNKVIESMGDIEKEYAHYTTEGMTEEEMSRVDRVKVMKLVESSVGGSGYVKSWNLSENLMTLNVSGASLSELNQIAAALEKEEIVDRCVIYNANRGDGGSTGGAVAVTFQVYLNDADASQKAASDKDAANGEEGQKQ